MLIEPSTTIIDTFHQGEAGLTGSSFDVKIYKNGIATDITFNISELSDGYYSISFTVDSTDDALWSIGISNGSVYNFGTYRAKEAIPANVIQNNSETNTNPESISFIRIQVDAIREMVSAIFRGTTGR